MSIVAEANDTDGRLWEKLDYYDLHHFVVTASASFLPLRYPNEN